MSGTSTPPTDGGRRTPGIVRDDANARARNGDIAVILPHERVFRIQIGSELFTLSGASLSSDGEIGLFFILLLPFYFTIDSKHVHFSQQKSTSKLPQSYIDHALLSGGMPSTFTFAFISVLPLYLKPS